MGEWLGGAPGARGLPSARLQLAAPPDDPAAGEILLDDRVRRQLRIARRAGELARLGEHDVACGNWDTAQREFLPDALRLSA